MGARVSRNIQHPTQAVLLVNARSILQESNAKFVPKGSQESNAKFVPKGSQDICAKHE
jgi:hypothetical protein